MQYLHVHNPKYMYRTPVHEFHRGWAMFGSVMNDMPERSPSQPSAQAIAQNAPITKRPPPTSVILPLAA